MSRRRNDNDGVIAALIPIGGFLIWFCATIFAFLVKIMVTALFYLFPIAAGLLWITYRNYNENSPILLDPNKFDDRAATQQISKLLADLDHWSDFFHQQYRIGRELGLFLTRASNDTRFDERSNKGRDLNRNLDAAEFNRRDIVANISSIRQDVGRILPKWRFDYEKWAKQRSVKDALRPCLFAYGTATIVLYAWSAEEAHAFYAVQSLLFFSPFGNGLVSPLVGSALAGCGMFYVARVGAEKQLIDAIDNTTAKAWQTLEAKWSPTTEARSFFHAQSRDEHQKDNQHKQRQDRRKSDHSQQKSQEEEHAKSERAQHRQPHWHEVLGVTPAASPEEIKAAYREAIKAYHSDKVASLGQKLRDLAEEESKRINVAYGQARKVRAF